MRVFLIILNFLCYLGGIISIIAFFVREGRIRLDLIAMLLVIILVNYFCARYLYAKASKSKMEWALFGFIGNFNAILFYWIYAAAKEYWNRNQRFFSG